MAETSGSGGLGALTLGGIAGVAVVLGGVVLFQLGVLGTSQPEGEAANGQAGSQAANDSGTFTGDGDESGQPLQNRAAQDAAEAARETAEAPQEAAGTEQGTGGPEASEAEGTAVAEASETLEPADGTVAGSSTPEPEAASAGSAASGEEDSTAAADAEQPAAAAAEPAPQDDAAAAGTGAAEELALAAPEEGAAAEAPEPPAAAEPKEEIFVLEAPELDLVRVDNEGAAVIAGRAQQGVQVSVLLDGEVLDQLEVPAGGEFVSLTTIAPSAEARVVSLLAEHGGQQSVSGASFILAPVTPVAAAPGGEGGGEQRTADAGAQASAPEETVPSDEQAAGLETAGTESAGQEVAAAGGQPDTAQDGGADAAATAASELGAGEDTAALTLATEPPAPQPQGQAVAVLRADEDGVEVVQPAVPADPELSDEIALDAISYNGTGGVELAGRARPQSRVRVYVDNQPVAELDAADDGRWNGRLEDVAPGIYTLRLDEIEPATGDVVSRLETPFKREAPEALPQPAGDPVPDQPAPLVRAVTVQKGDTLWAISQQKYGSGFLYVRVFEANRGAIRDPDLIYPGQVFTIPE